MKAEEQKNRVELLTSPEDLDNYLKTTRPSGWIILSAVAILLIGFVVWASVGKIELRTSVTARVSEDVVEIISNDYLSRGMPVIIGSTRGMIDSVDVDDYGRYYATAIINVPDGYYYAQVITDSIKPISFLFR
jgi:hypothetical protein